MVKIPESQIKQRATTRVQSPNPGSVDAGMAQALNKLGKAGERLGQIASEKIATSEFLNWREEYDSELQEKLNGIRINAKRMDKKGEYRVVQEDPETGEIVPTEEVRNINDDFQELQLRQKELEEQGKGLFFSESAQRHISARSGQFDTRASMSIFNERMDRLVKERDEIENSLILDTSNLIINEETGADEVLQKLNGTEQKIKDSEGFRSPDGEFVGGVKSPEQVKQKLEQLYTATGDSLVQSVSSEGLDDKQKKVLQKLKGRLSKPEADRLELRVAKAKETQIKKQDRQAISALRKLNKISPAEHNVENAVFLSKQALDAEVPQGSLVSLDQRLNAVGNVMGRSISSTLGNDQAFSELSMELIQERSTIGSDPKKLESLQKRREKLINQQVDRRMASLGEAELIKGNEKKLRESIRSTAERFMASQEKSVASGNASALVRTDPEVNRLAKNNDTRGYIDAVRTRFEDLGVARQSWNLAAPEMVKNIKQNYDAWAADPDTFYDNVNGAIIRPSEDLADKYMQDLHTAEAVDPGIAYFNKVDEGFGRRVSNAILLDRNSETRKRVLDSLKERKSQLDIQSAQAVDSLNIPRSARAGSLNQMYANGAQQIIRGFAIENMSQGDSLSDAIDQAKRTFKDNISLVSANNGENPLMFNKESLTSSGITKKDVELSFSSPDRVMKAISSENILSGQTDGVVPNYSRLAHEFQGTEFEPVMNNIAKEATVDPDRALNSFMENFRDRLMFRNSVEEQDSVDIWVRGDHGDFPLLMSNKEAVKKGASPSEGVSVSFDLDEIRTLKETLFPKKESGGFRTGSPKKESGGFRTGFKTGF